MRVIIATGGTGGHIFPALNVASELRTGGHEISFAGTFGSAKEQIIQEGYALEELQAKGLYTGSWRSVPGFLFSMIKAILKSFGIVRRLKPDAILGFGGYGAFPIVFAGAIFCIPTMIHEQNVLPGRANRLLAKMVKKIAISFKESEKHLGIKKTVWTGCPSRPALSGCSKASFLKDFSLQENKFTILLLGGSQGSHRINVEWMKTIPLLRQDLDFQFIHLSGQKDFEELNRDYAALDVPYYVCPFLAEMEKAYTVADLVIARAGALTVTEIAAFGLPAVLIPYPHAGGHQKENARILVEREAAEMIEEKDLSAERLKEVIMSFVRHPADQETITDRLRGIYEPRAALRLAEEVIKLKAC